MSASSFQIRKCQNPACGLRYPLVESHPFGERCPLCLGPTLAVLTRPLSPEPFLPLNGPALAVSPTGAGVQKPRLDALLDNIRSAWNVGAIFRTADGLGVEKLYLCGITPGPENAQVRKTALGAEQTIGWETTRDALSTARALIDRGYQLIALEQADRAIPLDAVKLPAEKNLLVVGNEVTGVDPALLDLCQQIAYIPMFGQKRSLNVEVAFGIAASSLIRHE